MSVNETEGMKYWLRLLTFIFTVIGVLVFLLFWRLEVSPIEALKACSDSVTKKEFIELKNQGIKSVIEALTTVAAAFGGIAANLEKVNLHEASLTGANLMGANLTGANLTGANLEGANFMGVKNLELDQIKLANGDSTTSLPKNIKDFKEEILAHWEQCR